MGAVGASLIEVKTDIRFETAGASWIARLHISPSVEGDVRDWFRAPACARCKE